MDRIFKIGLLVLGVAFLVLFYFHTCNGRYLKFGETSILDTANANVHLLKKANGWVFNPKTQTVNVEQYSEETKRMLRKMLSEY